MAQEKTLAVDLAAGTVAGTSQLLVGHPFDTVKVKLQTQVGKYNGAIDCGRKIMATHGPRGFFKGLGLPLGTVAVFNAVLFSTRGRMENLLAHADGSPLTVRDQVLCGMGGGFAGALLACPTELVKCRLQAQSGARPPPGLAQLVPETAAAAAGKKARFSGPLAVTRHVLTHEGGALGLCRGMVPTMLREVPGNAAMFGTYQLGRQAMAKRMGVERPEQLPMWAMMAAGGVAGLAFWMPVYPFDVIKSKIQTDNVAAPAYRGTMDCAIKTVRAEGVKGLFRGFGPAMARAVPANGAAFVAYELAAKAMSPDADRVVEVAGALPAAMPVEVMPHHQPTPDAR